jgi:hypothetical protein
MVGVRNDERCAFDFHDGAKIRVKSDVDVVNGRKFRV